MQSFTSFFGGAFFGGEFFSSTPNVGGGVTGSGSTANVLLRGRKRTSTEIMLDRQKYGLDERLERILSMWGKRK